MSKFVYKFEPIIRIKEVLEKKIAKEIALVEKEIEQTLIKKNSLIELRKTVHNKINSGQIKISEYKSSYAHLRNIEKEIHNIEKKITELKFRKEAKMEELLQRKKEKKVFERLKEIKLEEYYIDNNREEMKQLNEVAISNYIRSES